MDIKKLRKNIARFFAWLGLIFFSLISKFLPLSFLFALAKGISLIGYKLDKKHREVALESLSIAFGQDKTRSQIEQIAKDSFFFMAKSGIEILYLSDRPRLMDKKIQMAGREHLDAALAKGNGVIMVSAHFGSFPLALARLTLSGYKAAIIMRTMRDARADKMIKAKRDKFNIKTIYTQPRATCVNMTIDALRNNEIVFIPIDQNFGSGGVFVDFFGRKAATATGPVVLAQRTKAVILPCFMLRQDDDSHKMIIEPALELQEGSNRQDTISVNIQKLTNIIESYIRKYPAEWGWIHRRWKSKPEMKEV
ncbi:MAG: lysophospholipid acyltransferase family protein [Candidatus Omnitrophica bacterium]|nr:lysophospholipid acyltransferase family protein [Candidatus Omnitrophota bacterium]